MPHRRQTSGAAGYAFTRLTARAVGGALTTRRYQKQQRAAFQAWALARQPLVAQLRAVLADPAAAADLRDLARQVEAGRVLTAAQEEHAGRLLAAARIFADWARERQDLVRSLQAALNDRAAGPILRGLALQVTHGTSRLGPRPLWPRQEDLAREHLSEMHAKRQAMPRPDGTLRRQAAAGRQGAPAAAGGSPDRADARLARARARRRSLREGNQRFEAWAQTHQDLIDLLRDFTDDPRVPFLRDLAIQVTHGWDGRRMPLSPRQQAAVKRIFQARPDLRSAHAMPAEPAGRTDPERASLHSTRRPRGPARAAEHPARTARQADLEAGQ